MPSIIHPINPVYDCNSRVLLLGSFPSPKSRETGFYYGHPQNRFWRVLSNLFGETLPITPEERRAFALTHHIALWDVLHACEIVGASDASIKNPVPNDLSSILNTADIGAIFATGKTAAKLYEKYQQPLTNRQITCLPSTSPANCRIVLEQLTDAYREALGAYLNF